MNLMHLINENKLSVLGTLLAHSALSPESKIQGRDDAG